MSEITFTDGNFGGEVLKSGVPVLVDFWAPWCGPCKMQGPIIDELAGEIQGVKVGKLNVDENPEMAGKYNVMSIPTLVIFKGGEEIERMTGIQTKDDLAGKLEKLI